MIDERYHLLENGYLVGSLHHAVRGGAWGLENMPRLIREAIENKIWTGWTDRATGKTFSQPDFYTFITTPVLEGLGGEIHQVMALCRDDREALQLIHAELGENYSPVQFALREIKSRLSPDEIQELTTLLVNAERD